MNWNVTGARMDGVAGADAKIHDDCVEYDGMNKGTVVDSLFNGCYVFMSSRWGSTDPVPPGTSHKNVVIKDRLVRLTAQYQSFDPPKYGYNQSGGFFKWPTAASNGANIAPELSITGSTFYADRLPGSYGDLELPAGSACDRVTLAWDNANPIPAATLATWTSTCTNFTFLTRTTPTTALQHWNTASANWRATHPLS